MKGDDQAAMADGFRLRRSPGNLLRRNHQRSYEIFSDHVGADVTRQQIAVLIALRQAPGASQRALVDATGIDKSTLKEMTGRMIDAGWLTKERDANDARAWTFSLTPAGDAFLLERIERVTAAQEAILAPLPAELRPVFLRCLRLLLGLDN